MAESGPVEPSSRRVAQAALTVLDGLGKIWNSPNTLVGLAVGGLGLWFGGRVGIGHNAVEFRDSPLMDRFAPCGAITLGNVIVYGSRAYGLAEHERVHTLQGQFAGPAYLPLHAFGMALSLLSYPAKSLRRFGCSPFHGHLNFMEGCPGHASLYRSPSRR